MKTAIIRHRLCVAAVPAAIVLIAGCALNTPPDAAAIKAQAMPNLGLPSGWAVQGADPAAVSTHLLTDFTDEPLTSAVNEAINTNADLRVTQARVEHAMLTPSWRARSYCRSTCSRGGQALGRPPACRARSDDDVGAGPVGPRATAAAAATPGGRGRLRDAAVDGGGGRQNWFLATGRRCRRTWRARSLARAKRWSRWPKRDRASASAATKTCSSRAGRSARIATRCGNRARARAGDPRARAALGRHPAAACRRAGAARPAARDPAGLRRSFERRPDVIAAERRVAPRSAASAKQGRARRRSR